MRRQIKSGETTFNVLKRGLVGFNPSSSSSSAVANVFVM